MPDSSSQGLFVIVAVVIFGIFVALSYLLFRNKTQVGLASIFCDTFNMIHNETKLSSLEGIISFPNTTRDGKTIETIGVSAFQEANFDLVMKLPES